MKQATIASIVLLSLFAATHRLQAGENLLTNPSGIGGATAGWNIIADGGDGWAGNGQSVDGDGAAFITSYNWCTRSQTIDLVAAGFSETFLDRSLPLLARESFRGAGGASADFYFLKVELRAADGTVLDSWEAGTQAAGLQASSTWEEQSHIFENYPAGVRQIYWEDGGDDTEFWAGHYGTILDGAELSFIDPAPVEILLSPGSYPVNAPAGGVAGTLSAEDNEGSTHTFALVSEVAPVTLVELGSIWSYLDDGSDQGTAWSQSAFDDSTWPTGGAELGYGDGDEVTLLGGLNTHFTNYHRHRFQLSPAELAGIEALELQLKRDDGAIVYLNGTEIVRDNMPAGVIAFDSPAAGNAGDDGAALNAHVVPTNLLVAGENVLAVEIHQQSLTSSDTSFDLQLIAQFEGESYDNDLFTVDGDLLKFAQAASAVPVTVGGSWTVNVRTTDDAGNTLTEQLGISGVAAPTQAPTAINLLPAFVTEGQEVGSTVGEILATDPDTADYHTFALVAGAGSADNALFAVQSNRLVTATVLDDAQPTRSVRLRATDRGGFSFEQAISIEVRTFNNPPTDITFSGTTIERNVAAGTLIGLLDTADADADDMHVYSFVPTPGGETIFGFGETWRYLDDGSDLTTVNWFDVADDFDDSGWKSGTGSFGYGDAQDTQVDFGGDDANKHITTYFRRSFELADPAAYSSYLLQVKRDDGIAIYVNGIEVGRDSLDAVATALTLANATIGGDDEFTPISFDVPANLFVAGTNTIAAEVHQVTAGSSDLTFDLSLEGGIDASGERYFDIVNGNEIRSNATFATANIPATSQVALVVRSTDPSDESVVRSFSVLVVSDDANDLDGDGLPDAWELQYFPTIPGQDADDDSDGDGQTNGEEFLFGTLPNDGSSRFALNIERAIQQTYRISWSAATGRRYQLQYSTALSSGPWLDFGAPRVGIPGTMDDNIPTDVLSEVHLRLVVEQIVED